MSRRELTRRLARLEAAWHAHTKVAVPALAGRYPDPVEYAREVLKVELIPVFQEVLRSLTKPPRKTMVLSGHSIGKSHAAAVAINWFFDTYDPCQIITTAPTQQSVERVLWKEVRMQRMRAGLPNVFVGPAAPFMKTSEDHLAYGLTATKGGALQGRHDLRMLLVIDEAVDVAPYYWHIFKTMFKPEEGHAMLACMNPTDQTSEAYAQDENGGWRTFNVSSMEHPNIDRQLRGEEPLIRAAVTVSQIEEWIRDWCDPINPEVEEVRTAVTERQRSVEWPPGSGKWYRPSILFEARCLGIWPTMAVSGVWSDAIWSLAVSTKLNGEPRLVPPVHLLPEIGCDVAYTGADYTSIFVRWGPCGMHHEEANGWDHVKTSGRLMELAKRYAAEATKLHAHAVPIDPKQIKIKVDDDGCGGGVVSILRNAGYNVQGVNAATRPARYGYYPNKRSELWFETRDLARDGHVDLSRLPPNAKKRLKKQAMAVEWSMDGRGCRVVEAKEITKEKCQRSPDSMDAMNLAYYAGASFDVPVADPEPDRMSITERVFGKQRSY